MATQPTQRRGFGGRRWRIILSILGAAIACYGLFYISLGLIGTQVDATVMTVEMQGDFAGNFLSGPKGTVVVEYSFPLSNGQTITGSSTYKTDTDYSIQENLSQFKTISVRYFPFLPQVNMAAALTGLQVDSLVYLGLGILIILLINIRVVRHDKKQQAKAAARAAAATPKAAPPLEEFDPQDLEDGMAEAPPASPAEEPSPDEAPSPDEEPSDPEAT